MRQSDIRRHRPDLINCTGRGAQDKQSAKKRRQESAQGIEGLSQIKSAGSRGGRPQHGDVRIGGDLQTGNPRGKHNERHQKQRIRGNAGRWHEKKRAQAHGEQTHDHRSLIADPVNDLGRRNGEKKIRSEERKLNQHDLRVIQIENRLQMRDKNIVETGQKAPHKKQCSHCHQRRGVGF